MSQIDQLTLSFIKKNTPSREGYFSKTSLYILQKIKCQLAYKEAPVSGRKLGRLICWTTGAVDPAFALFWASLSLILITFAAASSSTIPPVVAELPVVVGAVAQGVLVVVVTTVTLPPVVPVVVVVVVEGVVVPVGVVVVPSLEVSAATPSAQRPS